MLKPLEAMGGQHVCFIEGGTTNICLFLVHTIFVTPLCIHIGRTIKTYLFLCLQANIDLMLKGFACCQFCTISMLWKFVWVILVLEPERSFYQNLSYNFQGFFNALSEAVSRYVGTTRMTGVIQEYRNADGKVIAFAHEVRKAKTIR